MTGTTVTKLVLLPLPLYSPHVAKGGEQRTRPPHPATGRRASLTRLRPPTTG